MAEITDGASNTYLIGEKYLNPDHYYDGLEASDNQPCYCGFDWDYDRWTVSAPRRDQPGNTDNYDFGSTGPRRRVQYGILRRVGENDELLAQSDNPWLSGQPPDGQVLDAKQW